ncbi:hypothetical protein COV53_04415 [Candidatus Gottesmanbacteria bacterium CG11_big_fil_rev_8_21_14_0_20_37_11]|uniref:DUF5666 domain-containing protein n=3 Tax=Candidatus Gottesmaniibacteriota TaxID=1752720 RepID=A0A2M7RSU9_9BACT|nr:MAG: hypothetical protein AUJ73_04445 [Candidatus Gottesmanbacteria bacterium CG1_02_37_22]PIP32700.1 MAG: hypothetical protein COX23_03430 [Candidatus Gottesmanbacteria bacterium CG23_combo_of_CG06-09_8_20_14_all_37_19]PIR08181.1 MAG: hypothetical protein COV53_04415 [Candidatus Gottesmanbacteria bacterium CG11_big_fil_rev_8_21_14_0_20_37_11]PIZ03109.1 MAG: hypothetical protein COY59_01215 [Candidatus Gottesmanbacteria bacterium CG_4_10_14_0_8_um_filter_37_24]
MKNNFFVIGLVSVLVGIGGFLGGMKYQESKTPVSNFNRQFQGGSGQEGRQGGQNTQGRLGGNFGRPITGDIISLDNESITVKLQDNSSKIVLLPDSTTISKTDQGSIADLKTGMKVEVFGKDNSDGSITAQNIQINPMFRTATDGASAR